MAGLIPRVLRRRALFGEEKRTRCGVPRFARDRIRRVPYIGVPRAVVERRMQRGQLIGGPQARVPLYVPYADFFQYQAGAGRRWPAARTYKRARTPLVPQGGRGARAPQRRSYTAY